MLIKNVQNLCSNENKMIYEINCLFLKLNRFNNEAHCFIKSLFFTHLAFFFDENIYL
jgi:hypothetical protein